MGEQLTPQQYKAVYNRGGRLLVSAAAGSGKTKVLVDRLLSYILDPIDPANLDDFLIITYTKAAASELRGKIASKLSEKIAEDPLNKHLQKQMQRLFLTKISTVHSFCSEIIREFAYKLDIAGDFRVADESECRELRDIAMTDLLEEVYRTLLSDSDFISFIDTQGLGRDDRYVPEIIEKVYDSARCHLNPDKWLSQCLDSTLLSDDMDVSQTLWGQYLIGDLKEYLAGQIEIIQACIMLLDQSENMEKVVLNLQNTLHQLRQLYMAENWDDIVLRRNIEYGRLTFPRKNVDADLAEKVKAVRNACKKGLERKLQNFSDDSQQIRTDATLSASGMRGLINLVKQFQERFQQVKHNRRVLDFSDLEHKTLDLLLGRGRSNPTAAAIEIGRRFREIMVDEYQDSNNVQDAIFNALSKEKDNCFLVGDVKQSIYQFRLADPGIFLSKYQTYADVDNAAEGQGRRVLLSHNFRSGPEIVECVNAVFRATMSPKVGGLAYGDDEALREGVAREPLPDTAVELYGLEVQEDTYAEEAMFVADRIHTMLHNKTLVRKGDSLQPVQPQDIVILLRSPGSAAGVFQQALEARGIRCTTGAGLNLLQTDEICTLRSFLQVITNPRQDIPLVSLLASPVFGFSANDLAAMRSRQKKGSIYDALCYSAGEKEKQFLSVLKELRQEARMNGISALLESCFRLTKLDSIYAAMPDGELRHNNLRMFYQFAVDYEKQGMKDLSQFLDFLKSAESRGLITTGTAASDAVTIMSIHKSKGLEFPVVFLSNLSRRFNMESLRGQILCDKELGVGLSVAVHQNRIRYASAAKRAIAVKMAAESISEEMRVLYVAMTRARDRLIMTYASQTLQNDLQDIVLRKDFDDGAMLCQEASCMGEWILMAAINRMEAGAFHEYSGRPVQLILEKYPWNITVCQAAGNVEKKQSSLSLPDGPQSDLVAKLQKGLSFRYPFTAATLAPSKRTATDSKGREKDTEVTEKTHEPPKRIRKWRNASFADGVCRGKEYGNVIHTVMQYITFENCHDLSGVAAEIEKLRIKGFLTQEQQQSVAPSTIEKFFGSEIGKKLISGVPYLREFKFSILEDASQYDSALKGEQVLLQGVVDCAILEPDGITIVDFKTDHVSEDLLPEAVERYRHQLQTYASAMHRIYEMPIKKSYLYFFYLNRFVEI